MFLNKDITVSYGRHWTKDATGTLTAAAIATG